MEPVNHWHPVTTEYEHELPPVFKPELLTFRRKLRWPRQARDAQNVPLALPTGITCVSWFYILAAGAYFVFGSVLLASPASDFAALLIDYFRKVIPLPAGVADGVPLDNMLAEAFFAMAMVSATIGVMWLVRYRPVRWLTLGYAGGELLRFAYYFLSDKGVHATELTLRQSQVWLAVSFLDTLIFCYLAFYSGVGQIFNNPE
jgi:hypothetical protein